MPSLHGRNPLGHLPLSSAQNVPHPTRPRLPQWQHVALRFRKLRVLVDIVQSFDDSPKLTRIVECVARSGEPTFTTFPTYYDDCSRDAVVGRLLRESSRWRTKIPFDVFDSLPRSAGSLGSSSQTLAAASSTLAVAALTRPDTATTTHPGRPWPQTSGNRNQDRKSTMGEESETTTKSTMITASTFWRCRDSNSRIRTAPQPSRAGSNARHGRLAPLALGQRHLPQRFNAQQPPRACNADIPTRYRAHAVRTCLEKRCPTTRGAQPTACLVPSSFKPIIQPRAPGYRPPSTSALSLPREHPPRLRQ
uniref:Uncharacterized protein n=1 Tax=Mycena chlorophos TaxID=658473 RepID=A0ABQ0KY08_MYCCL|nr:predicted protein [Mycena chlorophos]